MRALTVVSAVLLGACQSGVSIDVDGGLQFPCTPSSPNARVTACPGTLFCGADGFCHASDVGGIYACRDDNDCRGGFRCGPAGICLDPSADALRADAGQAPLRFQRGVPSTRAPWDAGITALGIGRSFYQSFRNGPLTDVSAVAVGNGRSLYVVARSQLGFTATRPPQQFFVGQAELAGAVRDVALARDQVFAIAGGQLYRFPWDPLSSAPAGSLPRLDAGVPVASAIGERLRIGNSPFPRVFEFKPDSGTFRVFDSANRADTGAPGILGGGISGIDDMADTDGQLVYAVAGGRVWVGSRLQTPPAFGTFQIHSPGQLRLLTNCGGGSSLVGEDLIARRLHVADNPDENQVEKPLVALELDYVRPDAGTAPYWMRLEPDPASGTCGATAPRHVGRGFCPACSDGERLVDMQWGIDEVGDAALRSECVGAAGVPSYYDLKTDSAGFSCFRKRRADVRLGAAPTFRARSNPQLSAVATRETISTRLGGLDEYQALNLDRAPVIARSYGELVAFGQRTLYRETPHLGLALHEFAQGNEPFPAWISRDWLLYDDGLVGPIDNLRRPRQDAVIVAAPSAGRARAPVFGSVERTATGRELLVMVSNDTLLSADLTDARVDNIAAIEARLVPEAQVPIVSHARLQSTATDGGPLLRGFVLTQNRVFSVVAETEQRWTAAQVGVRDGDYLEVWADRDRGRLGRADGAVFGLPSGVAIAPPFEPARTVVDYQAHCGRSYALVADGLYRLDAVEGDGLGRWVAEPDLPARSNWQKMYGAANGELWVFSADGSAALLKGDPCTP